jgi:glycosyltransferase involved in cell wall biosynthesis
MERYPVKILHTNFLRGWGGQSNRVLNEAVGSAKAGHTVLISAPPRSALLTRAGEQGLPTDGSVGYVGGARPGVLRDIMAMRRLLRRFQPDILHLHGGRDSWVAAAALFVRPPCRPIVVRTKHNLWKLSDHMFNRWQYGRFFEYLVAISEAVWDQCASKPYIDPGKMVLIPSAVDCGRFSAASGVRERVRKELGYEDHHVVVMTSARLRPEKGHAVLLSAVPKVIAGNSDVRFLIVGAGSLQGELEARVKREGLGSHVMMTGFRNDVPDCLAAADIYCHPALQEGLGTAVIEASAASLAVVASREGGIPDTIVDGKTGYLVPKGEPDPLADAILKLSADAPTRQAMGRAGRQRIIERFSVETLAEKTNAFYARIMEQHKAER